MSRYRARAGIAAASSRTSGVTAPTYRSCQTVVASASVSQTSTGPPERAARSSASVCRRATRAKSGSPHSRSKTVGPGSPAGASARATASLATVSSRPYSGTQPVRACGPPRARSASARSRESVVVPVDSAPSTTTRRVSQARTGGSRSAQCATGSARTFVPDTGKVSRARSSTTGAASNRRASSTPYGSELNTASTGRSPTASRIRATCPAQISSLL